MYYPLFERPEGFYYQLGLMPDWEDRLAHLLDLEEFSRSELDESEQSILHLRQLGYTFSEISWYYGSGSRSLKYKLGRILDRIAIAPA